MGILEDLKKIDRIMGWKPPKPGDGLTYKYGIDPASGDDQTTISVWDRSGTLLFIAAPPKDVKFNSTEELIQWYEKHPDRLAVIKNIGAVEKGDD